MEFDPDNTIIKLCAQGMEMEGNGKTEEAKENFMKAWDESTSDYEKSISAHYVARHQKSIADKLKWDETALHFALKLNDHTVKQILPSLYLNIAKCHEDLNAPGKARENYQLASSYIDYLPENGYGTMIKNGIIRGLQRLNCRSSA